jgi:hypothetical protein
MNVVKSQLWGKVKSRKFGKNPALKEQAGKTSRAISLYKANGNHL